MSIQRALQKEIKDSKKWLDIRKRGHHTQTRSSKRIELINWVLGKMKNPNVQICVLIESKMNEIILTIIQSHSIIEADKLHCELRIMDWIFIKFALMK